MISINELTVAFGGFTLLDDINFHISDGEHVALVGKNGAGKSTIMKLIMGIDSPTSGKVMMPQGINLGYLPQIMDYSKDKTVMEDTLTAFSELFELQDRLDEIGKELAERTDYESDAYSKLIVKMNDVNDRLAIIGADSPHLQAEQTLIGLGFKKEDLNRKRSTFSQGWNMRVELAKVLLRRPDMILLDEPTNHLDIESIQWLEDYLKTYSGSLLLISHDRRFLDAVTTRTVEVMLGKIHDYKVPYTKYKELRKERIAQQMAAYENQQRMIEKTEEFIQKFRYKPTKSNQVQSRIKALEKIDRIEVDEEDNSALNIRFAPAPRSGNVVFQAKDLAGGYPPMKEEGGISPKGNKIIFKNANIIIERGEKVAFVGRNGEGKSTMLKTIIGELDVLGGSATLGHNVQLGYYAQNQEDILNKQDTVWDTLDKVAVGDIRTKLRDILAAFLFKGNDIDKKVGVLSGGERSRLAMAKLILHPYNLLAMDEPTNHMDLRSKDIMKQALQKYDGTLVIVSHDRDFLDGLVDKIYEFRDGVVKEHLGGIQEFLERRKLENLQELERKAAAEVALVKGSEKGLPKAEKILPKGNAAVKGTADNTPADGKIAEKQPDNKLSFEEQKELRKKQTQMKNLEKKIEEYEKKLKEIEATLAAPKDAAQVDSLTREYLDVKRSLDAVMEEWMEMGD